MSGKASATPNTPACDIVPSPLSPPPVTFTPAKPVKAATPKASSAKKPKQESYELSEGEEEEEDDENASASAIKKKNAKAKPVPAWAQGEQLEAAIKHQFGGAAPVNPDEIFGHVIPPCDLERTFVLSLT